MSPQTRGVEGRIDMNSNSTMWTFTVVKAAKDEHTRKGR
jgi:hypothetical protein